MRKIPLLCLFATIGLVCYTTLSDDTSNSTPTLGSTHGVNLSQLRDISYRIDWVNQQTAKDLRLATLSSDSNCALAFAIALVSESLLRRRLSHVILAVL